MLMNMAMGRLTRDPELRTVNIGGQPVSVCEFSIAVNLGFGENQQTEFINCVAWRGRGENIAKFFQKGRMIMIQGTQKTSKYQDNNGVDRYKTEWIVDNFHFCDSANNNGVNQNQSKNNQSQNNQSQNTYSGSNLFYEQAKSGGQTSGAPF